jgi:glycosyltransferase involved in cell wall biosynthesis
VSRVSEEKNLEDFLGMPSAGYRKIMVGDGPMRAEYKRRYPDVEFVGFQTGKDLTYYYQMADAFVFPSRWETFGIVMIEAMACGTPVICSNQSSLPEVVGDAAILVDPTQPQAWTEALTQLLQDPHQRAALRAAGLQRAQRFAYTHTAQTTVEAYRTVIDQSGNQR